MNSDLQVTVPSSAKIIPIAAGMLEAVNAAVIKGFLRLAFKPFVSPGVPIAWQRWLLITSSKTMPTVAARIQHMPRLDEQPAMEVVSPIDHSQAQGNAGVILYIHGGALCAGTPGTHRSLTTRLAKASGMPVYVVDYRLAPEHVHPAGPDDVENAYKYLLKQGYPAANIVVGGDSAGGMLALSLALRIRASGSPMPAGLLLLSPWLDPLLAGESQRTLTKADPMLQVNWLSMSQRMYQCPAGHPDNNPLTQDLTGLPPMLVQVGSEEILLSDSATLAERAQQFGVPCNLEVQMGAWHVYQLQGFFLQCARDAIERLGQQAQQWVKAP